MTQPEVRRECLVDAPHLLDTEPTGPLPETLHVNRIELLDQDHRRFALALDRGTKRRLAGDTVRSAQRSRLTGAGTHRPGPRPRKRTPCCSWPRPFGILNRNTAPRCTQRLHQRRHRKHLRPVRLVGLQHCDFRCQGFTAPNPTGRLDQRGANRVRRRHPTRVQHPQSPLRLIIKPHGNRRRHTDDRVAKRRTTSPAAWPAGGEHRGCRVRTRFGCLPRY